jgi:hypothetical protein
MSVAGENETGRQDADMTASATSPVPAAPAAAMDATFIERNQIVERYLTGKLPPRGVIDFENWCREHPDLVDSIGQPDRVNAALKLMESAGRPEPWAEKPRRLYERPAAFFTAAIVASVAAVVAAVVSQRRTEVERQVAVLESQIATRPLRPVSNTRPIVVEPGRTGPSARPTFTLDGRSGEFADLKFELGWSRFTNFKVTLDRLNQGRVATFGALVRDSNGQLRIGLNSSALGPGDYQFTLEGVDWRGNAEPQAWATFTVAP